jgi:hypothetical protein
MANQSGFNVSTEPKEALSRELGDESDEGYSRACHHCHDGSWQCLMIDEVPSARIMASAARPSDSIESSGYSFIRVSDSQAFIALRCSLRGRGTDVANARCWSV